jgi:hypothetical protein
MTQTAVAPVDYDYLPEGEQAAFLALTEDETGTEVPEHVIQPRMYDLCWSGDARTWLMRIQDRGYAREVRAGVWVALAERAY